MKETIGAGILAGAVAVTAGGGVSIVADGWPEAVLVALAVPDREVVLSAGNRISIVTDHPEDLVEVQPPSRGKADLGGLTVERWLPAPLPAERTGGQPPRRRQADRTP